MGVDSSVQGCQSMEGFRSHLISFRISVDPPTTPRLELDKLNSIRGGSVL